MYFNRYLALFENGCVPKILLNEKGDALDFPIAMAKSSNKFSNNSKIKEFLELLKSKAESIR